MALGSYARCELCPGSDVDVMLLHDGGARGRAGDDAARELWYPLWDAGFVLGQSTRTTKEALALADEDLDALTGLLDLRTVAGDDRLVADLAERARRLARKRRDRVLEALGGAAAARHERPGPVAEMLEPNVKDGAGGLRDLQALAWAGWTLGDPGGLDTLLALGYLALPDAGALDHARDRLLDVRVALHRVTGARGDVLTLQEQDAVAAELGIDDADRLVRELAAASRTVTWIAGDVWDRVASVRRGPAGRVAHRDHVLADGVVLRDGRVALLADAPVDTEHVLLVAAAAARHEVRIERGTLARLRELETAEWGPGARAALVDLLRAGRAAIPVVEAVDHAGVLVRLLPEWEHVRARPQRNAYHRFTVDRHLLETVAECAAILDDAGFDGDVARRTRAELLLLGALLHDIGKGLPGDHATTGAEVARAVALRIGLDPHGASVLSWLVQHHLLLADTATRRDLGDEATIVRFGRGVRDTERLDLLYALTVGDSRATGPAAWSTSKAALVRQLFLETDALLERGVVGPGLDAARRGALDRHGDLLARRELGVEWHADAGVLECVVAAPDRTGLLATVAAVLAVHGFDVQSAAAYGDPETGMALEVFRGFDRFDRLDEAGRRDVSATLADALEGSAPLRDRLLDRIRRYRRSRSGDVSVAFDLDASSAATVVEVHAPDEVGLLARVAEVFADLDLDVTGAFASTTGTRVVDVFYVCDAQGAKVTAPLALDRLRATLVARLTTDYLLA